jgi:hypothetical protein
MSALNKERPISKFEDDVLFLTVKRKFFLDILSGKKKKEYRAVNTHFIKRFTNRKYHTLILQNGYATNSQRLSARINRVSVESLSLETQIGEIPVQMFAIHIAEPKLIRK